MSLGPSCSLRTNQRVEQKLRLSTLSITFDESSGDIPLYSLHRIRGLMKRAPIRITDEIRAMLIENLYKANEDYRQEKNSGWYCLTANYFIQAIKSLDRQLANMSERAVSGLVDRPRLKEEILKTMNAKKDEAIEIIKQWFSENHDALTYVMGGKIPWHVIQKLRANLIIWVSGASNPFEQPIEDMVMEVAKENGFKPDNAYDAWEAMGGELPKMTTEI